MASVLEKIRVVDFSRVFAGPVATQILGDLGADVIKIEDPEGGDDSRYYGVDNPSAVTFGASPSFLALNRNKRSIALDLRTLAGREVALLLTKGADVLVHNFRPGVMARWQLDYDKVAAINPRIVYCDFSAYGLAGPLSKSGANDLALQAHSGLLSMTGETGRDPVRCGTAVVDIHSGLAIVCGILAALLHRERSGEGQRVESSLLLSSAHLMSYFYTEYWLDGTVRGPMGTANHLTVPNQAFPTADGSAVIVAASDEMWDRCVQALDSDRLDRPEFRTAKDRLRNRELLVNELSAVTANLSFAELSRRLVNTRVVVSRVNSVAQAADHEQLRAAGGILEFSHNSRTVRAVTTPFHLNKTPTAVSNAPPKLADHSKEILREHGCNEEYITHLAQHGAFGK